MIGIGIKFGFQFFTEELRKRIGIAKADDLSRAGAFIRRTAKGLIRSGKKPAKPGTPPKSHAGLLRDLIFFGLDADTDSVVVGPQLLNSNKARGSDKTVPLLLEMGGAAVTAQGKPAQYHAFPFMQPAFDENRDKFANLFANSVK